MDKNCAGGSNQLVTTRRKAQQLAVIETDPHVLEMDQLVNDLCVLSCNSGRVLRFLKAREGKKTAIKDLKELVEGLVAATARAQIILHEVTKPAAPVLPLQLTSGGGKRLRLAG